jgi:hypothetical protein
MQHALCDESEALVCYVAVVFCTWYAVNAQDGCGMWDARVVCGPWLPCMMASHVVVFAGEMRVTVCCCAVHNRHTVSATVAALLCREHTVSASMCGALPVCCRSTLGCR